jgi:hypothetical protein
MTVGNRVEPSELQEGIRMTLTSRILAIIAVTLVASPANAWRSTIDASVRRNTETMLRQYTLYGDFCQVAYIGRIAVSPAPRLGTLRFEEGTEIDTKFVCKGRQLPYQRIYYRAGSVAGDHQFKIYVSDGARLQEVKVLVHVR